MFGVVFFELLALAFGATGENKAVILFAKWQYPENNPEERLMYVNSRIRSEK